VVSRIKTKVDRGCNSTECHGKRIQDNLNKSIILFYQAVVSALTAPNTKNTIILWDLISPSQKIILLNQSAILISEQWNVTQQLNFSRDNIKWNSLPLNVQLVLFSQHAQQILSTVTFQEWGWVPALTPFSNSTLLSFLSDKGQAYLKSFMVQLNGLTFNTVLDKNLINYSKRENLFEKFQKNFGKFYTFYLKPEYKDRYHKHLNKMNHREKYSKKKTKKLNVKLTADPNFGIENKHGIQTPLDVLELVFYRAFRILMKN
jgi:hypothetical protein